MIKGKGLRKKGGGVLAIGAIIFFALIILSPTVFELVGILFTIIWCGGALLIISIPLCLFSRPFKARKVKRGLLILPGVLALAMGVTGLLFSAFIARFVVPESWEWPIGDQSTVVTLPSGKKAVALDIPSRVQLYETDGRYLGGWFIRAFGGNIWIVRQDQSPFESAGAETVSVYVHRGNKYVLFDLGGQVLRKTEAPTNAFEVVERTKPLPGDFPITWYKWPLASPNHVMITILAGFIWVLVSAVLGCKIFGVDD